MSAEINVIIPPGKIGVHLKDFSSDVSSTVVTSVSPNSPLAGKVFQGDRMIYVNGVDVRKMSTLEILKVIQKFSNKNRVITFAHEKVPENNQLGDLSSTKDKSLSLSIGSEPTQSTNTSTENECTCCDQSPHYHLKKNHQLSLNLSKSPASPAKDLKVEITNDDVDDEHLLLSTENPLKSKAMKYVRLSFTTSNEDKSPVPTAFLDRSTAEASFSKRNSPSMMICSTEDPRSAPIPSGFVFDKSVAFKSSMNATLYKDSYPATNTTVVKAIDGVGEFPHSKLETPLQVQEEGYSALNHRWSSPNNWSQERYHAVAQSTSTPAILQSAMSNGSSNSFVSCFSSDLEEPMNEHFEIVADAVVVNDTEVYDAELINEEEEAPDNGTRTPHIGINNIYSSQEEKSQFKRQGWSENKFFHPALLLIAIIVGCGFIATGVIFGMKESTSNTSTSTAFMASTANSLSTINNHSQTYKVTYSNITNHYYIEYKNRTVDVGPTRPACPDVMDDELAIIPSTFNSSTIEYGAPADAILTTPSFNASLTTECLQEYFKEHVGDYSKPTLLSSSPGVTTSSTRSTSTSMDHPPSDIEGRCSASNLPGSLSACLTACLPSACCYPDFNGETCLGNSVCSLYRPYCDVFYDGWIDGSSGVLKAVTDEMFSTCKGTNGTNMIQISPASNNQSMEVLPKSSSTVNRLRGHLSHVRNTNSSPSTKEACHRYCIAAKCCHAPVITDLESSGLVLSLTGAFINVSNGEYVMTNCQNTRRENLQLCAEYQKICSKEMTTDVDTYFNESRTEGITPTTKPKSDSSTKATAKVTTPFMTTIISSSTITTSVFTTYPANITTSSAEITPSPVTTSFSPSTTPATTSTEISDGKSSSTITAEWTTEIAMPVRVSGNDKCEDAIPLKSLPAYLAGTNLMATPDFTSKLEPLCGTNLGSKGVWYSFESDKRRIVRLEYELKLQGVGDSVLSIFTGSCATGSLTCVKSVTGAADYYHGGNNGFAIYEFLSEVGETYRFLLSGADGDTAGEYEFRVTEYEIPSNDVCAHAIKIITVPGKPLIFNNDTMGATPDFNDTNVGIHGCAGMDWYTRGLWYQIIGKGTNVRLEYYMYSIGLGNSELSIFTGSCADLLCYDNSEGSADYYHNSYNAMAPYEMFATESETYSFLLYGANFNTAGEFELKVTEYEVPSNDECSKATEVNVSPSTPFVKKGLSTLGATPDFTESDVNPCGVNWYTRGVWYHVVGLGSVIRMEYQLYSVGIGASKLAIFTGSCESLSCYDVVDGAADYYYGGNNQLAANEFIAEKNMSYFVWLSGENFFASAMYDFTVSEYDIPSNDKCENATTISPGTVYTGKTSGSTPDFNAFNEKCGGAEDNYGVWYSFTGNGELTHFSYTPSYDNPQLSFFGGSCDNLICEKNYGTETSFSYLSVRGRKYHLFLAGNSFDAMGDFSLSMEQYERPSNDACVNALEVTIFPYEVKENMKGATPDFDDETVKCGEDPLYSGVWYSFVGTGKEFTLELKTAGTSSDFWGEIAVFKGQCDQLECIIQHDSTGENAIVNASVPSITGVQYYVLIANLGLPTYDVFFQFTVFEEEL